MQSFRKSLEEEIFQSLINDFGRDNYDEYRFGQLEVSHNPFQGHLTKVKRNVKSLLGYGNKHRRQWTRDILNEYDVNFNNYRDGLEAMYRFLSVDDQKLIVKLIAYRLLGYTKIKLPFNTPEYWQALQTAKSLRVGNDTYDPNFLHFTLDKFDLNPIGYNIKFYFSVVGVAIDYIAEQYAYRKNGKAIVEALPGDFVLDVGGCWGDTAMYFAHKVGGKGKVFSFEFIPGNIELFSINTAFNGSLRDRITLIPQPVSSVSNQKIYYKDYGPGSKVEFEPFDDQTGTTKTVSIDDYVLSNNITAVDFIKMDIEGAELSALEGASNVIRKFRPKLAIAIYHSMEDFVKIPKWIMDLDLGYEIFIGHYTIHAEETICFAKPKER